MKKVRNLIILWILALVSFDFASAREVYKLDNKHYYVEMPILIFNIAEKRYESYTDDSLKSYLSEEVYEDNSRMSEQELEKAYTKNNHSEIKIRKVEFSNDGKYAYVYALMKAPIISLDEEK